MRVCLPAIFFLILRAGAANAPEGPPLCRGMMTC